MLSARGHGENGAIVSLLTENNGRHAGYVRGAHSSKSRGTLEVGNLVDVNWQSRVEGQLGSYTLELSKNPTAHFIDDSLKLSALQSACALCDAALPEREGHPGLFYGLQALFTALSTDIWGPAYVMWEIAFLRELGFSLDLTKCAGGGDSSSLIYVSPKTGRAVSEAAGEPYKEKLLLLPGFLRRQDSLPPLGGGLGLALRSPKGEAGWGGEPISENADTLLGLRLTAHFLEHWVFAHHTHGVPEARARFQDRLEKSLDGGQSFSNRIKQAF